MGRKFFALATIIFLLTVSIVWFQGKKANTSVENLPVSASIYNYQVVNTYPHDPQAFTQGLFYDQGFLYEGTGLYGQSSLRKVELTTGTVIQKTALPQRYFGEGISLWQDKIVQLTWKSQVGFVYNQETFNKEGEFTYPTEGWGITNDGDRLIMSDGTDNLYFLDPETFKQLGSIKVRYKDKPVRQLNELEYINGEIFANIWTTNFIARISPRTGEVLSLLDLRSLNPDAGKKGQDVLNGIAYDEEGKRLFVTGKLWPKLYEIELVESAEK
ncbi:MAG: glutaminyl-peptide cyclotransferase [Spirulinaceae cyanobacterium]